MKKRAYQPPVIESARSYETSALACGKTNDPPPGSFHFSQYLAMTGHFGPGFGPDESVSGTAMTGTSPMMASQSYSYAGLCTNWVTWQS